MTATLRRIELRSVVWEVLALVTVVSALVWPTILQLVDKWRPIADNVLGHSWPVVAVALWGLIRDARSVPVRLPWRIERVPLLFTAIVSGAWALAFQAALGAAQQMIWPFFIGGVIWATLGAPALRALSRALTLLLFVVPVWVVILVRLLALS